MLKAISWNQYGTIVGLAILGWYVYVLLRYSIRISKQEDMSFSPADRTGLFVNAQQVADAEKPISRSEKDMHATPVADAPQLNLVMQTVTQEVRGVIKEAADQGISDAELAARLGVILSNYPDQKDTAYGTAVNDLIIREATAVGFSVTKEQLFGFWE